MALSKNDSRSCREIHFFIILSIAHCISKFRKLTVISGDHEVVVHLASRGWG